MNVRLKVSLARVYLQACAAFLKFEAAEASAPPHHLLQVRLMFCLLAPGAHLFQLLTRVLFSSSSHLQSYSDSDGGGLGSTLADLSTMSGAESMNAVDEDDVLGANGEGGRGAVGALGAELELLPQVQLFVGFISRFFYKRQSVSKLVRGVMKGLDRSRFYVVAFTIMSKSEDEKRALREDADEVVELPMDLHASRQAIRQVRAFACGVRRLGLAHATSVPRRDPGSPFPPP